jgi:serine protease Do
MKPAGQALCPSNPEDSMTRTRLRTLSTYLIIAALGAGGSLAVVQAEGRGGGGTIGAAPAAPAAPVAPVPTAPLSPAASQAVQLSDAFAAVAEQVSPSVVTIQVEGRAGAQDPSQLPFPFFGREVPQRPELQRGSGSGVVLRADGAILTNNHVVQNAERITVVLQNGRSYRAKVVGTDPATDLAVLRIDAKGLKPVPFADSSRARVGDWVVAIGSPFGLDYTLTAGVLSAKGRGGLGANEIEDYLQTDASINPGNSGGPLVDLHGHMLGINTMIVGRNSGIGFAIPANLANRVAGQLLERGQVQRAWIGVGFQELTPELANSFGTEVRRGALVSSLVPDGPADRAGIRNGDVIEKLDGTPVERGADLLRNVLGQDVGKKLAVQLLRDGKRMTVTLTTAERPANSEQPPAMRGGAGPRPELDGKYGLSLIPLDPELARRLGYTGEGKLVVKDVAPGSAADRAGLRQGDVIVSADKQPVKAADDLKKALSDGKALLRVEREGTARFAVLQAE